MFTQQKVVYYQPKAYIDISRISKIGLVTNLAIMGIIRGGSGRNQDLSWVTFIGFLRFHRVEWRWVSLINQNPF